MKSLGYATGQFGKNHVGDRNPTLPTVNGFDEFFGNLYHLNAEEEPELPDYPKNPEYLAKFGPRGVLHTYATDVFDETVDPRFGVVGKNNGVKSARNDFYYTDDDALLVAIRKGVYKYVFSEQRKPGTMGLWAEPFTTLRLHKVFNLFQDPYERADITSNTFWDWQLDHIGSMYGVMDDVFKFAETFDEFPPRSYPPSFNPANIMEHKLRMIQVEQELRKAFPILPEPVKPEPKN
jgi:arylsulfatase A-like enzyme